MSSKRIALQDITAVHIEGDTKIDVLGFLVWYSIGEQQVEREQLENLLDDSGCDLKFLPKEIRPQDAFRRATKAIERKETLEEGGTISRFFVREVYNGKDAIQRNLVKEVVDGKGKRLAYSEKEALFFLDKESGLISFSYTTQDGVRLGDEAMANFDVMISTHDGAALRAISRRMLLSMSPANLRNSGGVHFVPFQYEQELRSMIRFISSLERGEGRMIHLVNSAEHLEMVRQDALKQVRDSFKKLEAIYNSKEVNKNDIYATVNDVELSFNIINDYRVFLQQDMTQLESNLLSVQKMLNNVKQRTKKNELDAPKRRIRLQEVI